MLFYVDGKKERYDPLDMKKDKKIGEGKEVLAYKIGNQAVKFYRPARVVRFLEEDIDKLKKIDTNRILLPKQAMLDKRRNVAGYKMDYIEDLGEDSFLDLSKDRVKEEMKYLKKDVELLSNQGVILEDLHHVNTVYHDGIYLIDPGRYRFIKYGELKEKDKIQCYGINIDHINEYLISILNHFSLVKHTNIENSYLKSGKENMMDYLSEIKEDTLREYVDSIRKGR